MKIQGDVIYGWPTTGKAEAAAVTAAACPHHRLRASSAGFKCTLSHQRGMKPNLPYALLSSPLPYAAKTLCAHLELVSSFNVLYRARKL